MSRVGERPNPTSVPQDARRGFGRIGDATKLLPAIAEEIRKRKGKK